MSTAADSADQLAEQAVDCLQRGDFAGAEVFGLKALQVAAGNFKALNALGLALHSQGKFEEAEATYLRVTEVDPQNAMHWMNVGTARRCTGRFDEALYAFARASALGANTADFYYNVALAHIERDDYESARALLEQALRLEPQDAEIRFRYAFCCYETMRMDEANAALEGWDAQHGSGTQIGADIGHLLMKLGDSERAEPAVRAAAEAPGADPQARLTLIQVLERINRIAEASRLLDQLLDDPSAAQLGRELIVMQAQIAQREGHHANAADLFRKALSDCKELHNRHFQEFPLARSLDALGQPEEAFLTAESAHRSQAAHLKLSAPLAAIRGAPLLSITDHSCDPLDVARWDHSNAPTSDQSPVFIVAFPRSGTTLLEVALDAHPLLKSMDEQPFLQNAIDDILELGIHYPESMATLSAEQLGHIRDRYWERSRRKASLAPSQRLIDKNPLNLLRLPAIKRLFPHARILLAIRHPCDVMLSCFTQHFRAPDFALLCRDLPTLAAGYCRAFDFWYSQQGIVEANVFDLQYEQFVSDFDHQLRNVFEFLDVPWNEAVLEPGRRAHEKRFISTPSYSQVIEPVTSKAVGKWQRYRRQFEPVLPLIAPYLARWGYAA